jgi:hypothetical protein
VIAVASLQKCHQSQLQMGSQLDTSHFKLNLKINVASPNIWLYVLSLIGILMSAITMLVRSANLCHIGADHCIPSLYPSMRPM